MIASLARRLFKRDRKQGHFSSLPSIAAHEDALAALGYDDESDDDFPPIRQFRRAYEALDFEAFRLAEFHNALAEAGFEIEWKGSIDDYHRNRWTFSTDVDDYTCVDLIVTVHGVDDASIRIVKREIPGKIFFDETERLSFSETLQTIHGF